MKRMCRYAGVADGAEGRRNGCRGRVALAGDIRTLEMAGCEFRCRFVGSPGGRLEKQNWVASNFPVTRL